MRWRNRLSMVELHCLCRKPEVKGVAMIFCDRCRKWFHPPCLKLTKKQFEKAQLSPSFLCNSCKDVEAGEKTFDVNFIVSRRRSTKGGKYEYLIRWKGYSSRHDTWEPEANLTACWDVKMTFDREQDRSAKGKDGKQTSYRDKTSIPSPKKQLTRKNFGKNSPSKKILHKKKLKSNNKANSGYKSRKKPVGAKRKYKLEDRKSNKKARPDPDDDPEGDGQQSLVEAKFLDQYGEVAYKELKLQLDEFVTKQKAEHKDLTGHQMNVYKETYVDIYTQKLKKWWKKSGGNFKADFCFWLFFIWQI